MENKEQKTNEEEKTIFSLDVEEEKEALGKIVGSGGNFLKMEKDIAYKIKILSPLVETKKSTFVNDDGINPTRYVFEVEAKSQTGDEYIGPWEVGAGIMREIFKSYEKNAVYTAKKTGSGLETKYNIVKDF